MKDHSSTTPSGPDEAAQKTPQAQTIPAQGERQRGVPRMPHERDESGDSQTPDNASMQRVGRAAHADAKEGVPDTSKGAEMDAAYDKLREDSPEGQKKFSP